MHVRYHTTTPKPPPHRDGCQGTTHGTGITRDAVYTTAHLLLRQVALCSSSNRRTATTAHYTVHACMHADLRNPRLSASVWLGCMPEALLFWLINDKSLRVRDGKAQRVHPSASRPSAAARPGSVAGLIDVSGWCRGWIWVRFFAAITSLHGTSQTLLLSCLLIHCVM